MKTNLYYQTIYRRQNILKRFILGIFTSLASHPKLLLEVFIRKNFGERYFTLASAITVAAIAAFLPWLTYTTSSYMRVSRMSGAGFWAEYGSWYLFLAAFGYFSFRRWQEVKRNPSVFDFERFSLHTGDINPLFFKLSIFGKKPSIRTVEIFYEPAAFFIVGLFLWQFDLLVGKLLMVCSIFYSLSYAGNYMKGDDFVMDMIDQRILNEELENAFVNDLDTDKTRGVRFYAHKPNSKEDRQTLADDFVEKDEEEFTLAH